jgi:hypothetical protein
MLARFYLSVARHYNTSSFHHLARLCWPFSGWIINESPSGLTEGRPDVTNEAPSGIRGVRSPAEAFQEVP